MRRPGRDDLPAQVHIPVELLTGRYRLRCHGSLKAMWPEEDRYVAPTLDNYAHWLQKLPCMQLDSDRLRTGRSPNRVWTEHLAAASPQGTTSPSLLSTRQSAGSS